MSAVSQFARLVVFGVLAVLLTAPVWAQRGVGQGKGKRQPPPQSVPQTNGSRSGEIVPGERFNPRRNLRAEGVPPQFIERLRNLEPAEQERVLANNRRFREMSPAQQEEIRRRLRLWNGMTADQQRAIREREEIWRAMSPEQRRRVRQEILPRWQQLPVHRRQAILRRLHVLHDLSESERSARLGDERFLAGLNDEDRELLRELSRLRVGPAEHPAEEAPPE